MKKMHMTTHINAPVATVWDKMLDLESYKVWTEAFNPGSYYKGDWSEGSKILFIGPDPENPESGEEGGMVSRIAENREYEFISIEHLGILKNGIEDTTSEEAKKWAPAYENYTFAAKDGGTELTIDMDIEDEYQQMFTEMWEKALVKLKEICENPA